MAQLTSGIRRVLSVPQVYNLFQAIIGGDKSRKSFADDYMKLLDGMFVLDIGSGTSEMLAYMPSKIKYYGYDISSEYIKYAKAKYKNIDAVFADRLFTDKEISSLPKFDLVYAGGLLHHLNDSEVRTLFLLVSKVLKPNGRFLSIDPCYSSSQSKISRFLISRDRGQNVRSIDRLHELALEVFATVKVSHENNLLRIPYDHAILDCGIGEPI